MDRRLRARVLWAEAQALGVTIGDLIAAARDMPADGRAVPTVAEYVDTIGPTLSPGTAATYRSYWRLAIARFGDRPLDQIGVDDCEAVVADAVARAERLRRGSDGGPHGRAAWPRCGRCSGEPRGPVWWPAALRPG